MKIQLRCLIQRQNIKQTISCLTTSSIHPIHPSTYLSASKKGLGRGPTRQPNSAYSNTLQYSPTVWVCLLTTYLQLTHTHIHPSIHPPLLLPFIPYFPSFIRLNRISFLQQPLPIYMFGRKEMQAVIKCLSTKRRICKRIVRSYVQKYQPKNVTATGR